MDGEATLVVTVEMDNEAKSVGLVEREILRPIEHHFESWGNCYVWRCWFWWLEREVKVKTIAGRFLLVKCQLQRPGQPPERFKAERRAPRARSPKRRARGKREARSLFYTFNIIHVIHCIKCIKEKSHWNHGKIWQFYDMPFGKSDIPSRKWLSQTDDFICDVIMSSDAVIFVLNQFRLL